MWIPWCLTHSAVIDNCKEHGKKISEGHLSQVFRYFLELASSSLAQTLLNPSRIVCHWLYLYGMHTSAKKWQLSK